MRAFVIRMLQAVIQMLTPKENTDHPTESDWPTRMIEDLHDLTGEFRTNGSELLGFTLKGTIFEFTDSTPLGGGIHKITKHGFVTPAGKDRMKVVPGDRFYITWGGEFHWYYPL
ncbi:hypothetical protein [Shimazuella kribbensis]|uniref:hypothetical protein n=1 Tax=Shimazuella kribbensis TaxID=139808 RepID=UPI00048AFBFC|nr:hypothetical protein [Shimazuella kribbensis]